MGEREVHKLQVEIRQLERRAKKLEEEGAWLRYDAMTLRKKITRRAEPEENTNHGTHQSADRR